MKSKPRHRRQVNKQALQNETKEAARKQFGGAALSFTTVLLFTFFFNFLPVQQVRPTQNLGSVGLNFKTGQLGKRYVKATEIPFFI